MNTTPSFAILIMSIVLSGIGVFWQGIGTFVSPATQTTMQPDSRIKKVIQPNAIFYTQVFLQRNKTFISIPYKFEGPIQSLWISYAVQENAPSALMLMDHPLLHTLSWKRIENNAVSLYQKNPRYTSIEAFLSTPPANSRIAIDPALASQGPYKKIQAQALTDTLTEADVDYILTTYHPPRKDKDWYYFETTLDLTAAQLTADNNISWRIFAPQATEQNPFYLGEIHIDYR